MNDVFTIYKTAVGYFVPNSCPTTIDVVNIKWRTKDMFITLKEIFHNDLLTKLKSVLIRQKMFAKTLNSDNLLKHWLDSFS